MNNNYTIEELMDKISNGIEQDRLDIEKYIMKNLIINKNFDAKEAKLLLSMWGTEIKRQQIKYEIITKCVYEIVDESIDDEILDYNIEKLETQIIQNGFLQDDKSKVYCQKIVRHIRLADIQKKYIVENLKSLTSNIKKAEDEVQRIKETKNKIYTEFVAILGIFSSIIFGVFGGFQEIQLIGKNLNDTPIPKLLIFSSLVMLGITLIIFLCFNAVSKLLQLPLRSCSCDVGECSCSFHKKHPTIVLAISIFSYTLVVGFALRLYKYNDFTISDLYNDIAVGGDVLQLILLTSPILIILAIILFNNLVKVIDKISLIIKKVV